MKEFIKRSQDIVLEYLIEQEREQKLCLFKRIFLLYSDIGLSYSL